MVSEVFSDSQQCSAESQVCGDSEVNVAPLVYCRAVASLLFSGSHCSPRTVRSHPETLSLIGFTSFIEILAGKSYAEDFYVFFLQTEQRPQIEKERSY